MTELETQLLKIIEEQQQQLQEQQEQLKQQQQILDVTLKQIVDILSAQANVIKNDQNSLQQVQNSLLTIQTQFQGLERNTANYTKQINGKVSEMNQIMINNEDVLVKISQEQLSVSETVMKSQQNLRETFEILKKISSK